MVIRIEGVEINGTKIRNIFIGRREELGVLGFAYDGENKEMGKPDDICMFLDIQYGKEDIAELRKQLRSMGLEFDEILIFCG